jgi:hypothetical protein
VHEGEREARHLLRLSVFEKKTKKRLIKENTKLTPHTVITDNVITGVMLSLL